VLAQSALNDAGWIYQDLDLTRLSEVRNGGQVFNFRDWPAQFDVKVVRATV
jgi:predicted amidohydrolase